MKYSFNFEMTQKQRGVKPGAPGGPESPISPIPLSPFSPFTPGAPGDESLNHPYGRLSTPAENISTSFPLTRWAHGSLSSFTANLSGAARYPWGSCHSWTSIFSWGSRSSRGRNHLHRHLHSGHVVAHALCKKANCFVNL